MTTPFSGGVALSAEDETAYAALRAAGLNRQIALSIIADNNSGGGSGGGTGGGLTTQQVQALIDTALNPYEGTSAINAAITAAVAGLSSGGGGGSAGGYVDLPFAFTTGMVSVYNGSFSAATLSYLFDGDTSTPNNFVDVETSGNQAGYLFDLGTPVALEDFSFVTYYGDGRTYHNVMLETSSDGVTYATARAAADVPSSQTPIKTQLNGQTVRYVRLTSTGSSANTGFHLIEVTANRRLVVQGGGSGGSGDVTTTSVLRGGPQPYGQLVETYTATSLPTFSASGLTASVANSRILLTATTDESRTLLSDHIDDGELVFNMRDLAISSGGINQVDFGVLLRVSDDGTTGYLLGLREAGAGNSSEIALYSFTGTTNYTVIGSLSNPAALQQFDPSLEAVVLVRLLGDSISVYVDGDLVGRWKDSSYSTGRVGFRGVAPAQVSLGFISVFSIGATDSPGLAVQSCSGSGGGGVDTTAEHYKGAFSTAGHYYTNDIVVDAGTTYIATEEVSSTGAAQVRGVAHSYTTNQQSLAGPTPVDGTAEGDLLVLAVSQIDSNSANGLPSPSGSGWIQQFSSNFAQQGQQLLVWTKVATADDLGTEVAVDGPGLYTAWTLASIEGAGAIDAAGAVNSGVNPTNAAQVTTTVANDLVLYVVGANSGLNNTSAGWSVGSPTLVDDVAHNSGGEIALFTEVQASAGQTPLRQAAVGGPAAIVVTLAIKPGGTLPHPSTDPTRWDVLPGGGTAGDTAWTALALQPGVTSQGGAFAAPGYRKDAQGFVHLRGVVGAVSVATQTPFDNYIATLPVGYRPGAEVMFAAFNAGPAAAARVDVTTDGRIGLLTPPNGVALSLDGLTFFAEG